MRYLVCLVGGFLIGALLAVTAASILGQRHAWPRAIMTVMQQELGRARDAIHAGQCGGTEVVSGGQHLELLSGDIERALLAPGAHDRVFSQYVTDLRGAVATFNAAGADCAARRDAATKIANACDACHRDYK